MNQRKCRRESSAVESIRSQSRTEKRKQKRWRRRKKRETPEKEGLKRVDSKELSCNAVEKKVGFFVGTGEEKIEKGGGWEFWEERKSGETLLQPRPGLSIFKTTIGGGVTESMEKQKKSGCTFPFSPENLGIGNKISRAKKKSEKKALTNVRKKIQQS